MKTKYKILLTIFTICLVVSTLLALTSTEQICGQEDNSCSVVQNSSYQKTLGISNSILGILTFTFLLFITASHTKHPKRQKKLFLFFTTTISAVGALYFIYIQAVILEAFCTYCMIIDIGSILALIILIVTRKQ
jgi:uncharacterized membrane protein